MTDLKIILKWLGEEEKIVLKSWKDKDKYLHIKNDNLMSEDGDIWEFDFILRNLDLEWGIFKEK